MSQLIMSIAYAEDSQAADRIAVKIDNNIQLMYTTEGMPSLVKNDTAAFEWPVARDFDADLKKINEIAIESAYENAEYWHKKIFQDKWLPLNLLDMKIPLCNYLNNLDVIAFRYELNDYCFQILHTRFRMYGIMKKKNPNAEVKLKAEDFFELFFAQPLEVDRDMPSDIVFLRERILGENWYFGKENQVFVFCLKKPVGGGQLVPADQLSWLQKLPSLYEAPAPKVLFKSPNDKEKILIQRPEIRIEIIPRGYEIDEKSITFEIDGKDVTEKAEISNNVILYTSENDLTTGKHVIHIIARYKTNSPNPRDVYFVPCARKQIEFEIIEEEK